LFLFVIVQLQSDNCLLKMLIDWLTFKWFN